MRALLALAVLFGGSAAAEPVDLSVREITRFSANPAAVGRLAFRGGVRLRGPRRFGAISGLITQDDRFLAATDTGHFITGRFTLTDGRLTGVADVAMTPRRDADGVATREKGVADAEALTKVEGGALVLVEQGRTLLRYPLGEDLTPFGAPRTVLSRNRLRPLGSDGIEALATLGSGDVLIIAEGLRGTRRTLTALTVAGTQHMVRQRDGFAITGADTLPGGDLLLVERRYGGGLDVSMRIRRIGRDRLASGKPLDGPILLTATLSAQIDNMEAIAVDGSGPVPAITVASDDNHSFWQRTLFLRFELADPVPRQKPVPGG